MGIFKKKEKEVKEPASYLSATNIETLNYKVYYFSKKEKLMYSLIAFIVGAAVGYLFYGGLGKDADGNATTVTYVLNILISTIIGLIAVKLFLPIRNQQIITKRKRNVRIQFRDMLEALNTSLGAGKNVVDSFHSVYDDMKMQYDDDAYILKELEVILSGMQNNIDIENLLADFGERSGIDDIKSFANVFRISYRRGGNIKETIRNTQAILSDKMEISEDIETIVTSNKNEQNIMLAMPILLIGMIKITSADFAANFATPAGIMATTIGVIMFVSAYYVGKNILDIKV